MFRLQNLPKSVMFLTHIRAFQADSLIPPSRKSLEIQASSLAKRRPFPNQKFVYVICWGAVIPGDSRNSEESIVS